MRNFWKKKVPAFLLALLMVATLVPMAGAASADITYTVDENDNITFDHDDFKAYFNKSYTGSLEYICFTDISNLDATGALTTYTYDERNDDWDPVDLDEDDALEGYFYYSDNDVTDDPYTYCLDGLGFEADDKTDGEVVTLEFIAYGTTSSKKVSGTLVIEIGDVESGSSSSGDGDITYTVDENDDVTFDRDDFKAYFNKTYSGSLEYVRFTDISNLDETGVLTTYINDKNEWDAVNLDEDDALDGYFYYSDNDVTDTIDTYCLDGLGFEADNNTDGEVVTLDFTAYGTTSSKKVYGTLVIEIGDVESGGSSSANVDGDIVYSVEEDDEVSFDPDDFKAYFNKTYSGSLEYIRFTDITNLNETGVLTTYSYDDRDNDWTSVDLNEAAALDGYFFYSDDDVTDTTDYYCLDGLGFEADDRTDGEVVVLEFTAYGTTSTKKVYGTLVIEIGDVKNSSSSKADLEYELAPEKELVFDEEDFNEFFQETYSNYDFKYLFFTGSKNLGSYNGSMYYKYGRSAQEQFSTNSLKDAYFYYDDEAMPDEDDCYSLEDLSFVASKYFDTAITLEFTAYYSSSKQVSGTVTISPKAPDTTTPTAPSTSGTSASILYKTTPGTNVQLKSNDFVRFYESKIPGSTFQSVKLLGVPATGGLYYNYSGASPYGTAARLQLTAYNCGYQTLYPSPVNTSQYALTELTFVPAANTTNYTASIPFAASGTGGYTVYGSVMISVTSKAIPEIYGVTPKNAAVPFPAASISTAVSTGTSATLLGIQLLELPAANVGAVYVGTGTARKATTSDIYAASGNSWTISQLRFVPASGYTGNVEIPYLAYDTNAKAIGVGTFSLGVVNKQVKFSDINSATWCYKYVAELSDAGVISGYNDGSFKPGNTISYGAALKMIMLAAGYPVQAPTSGSKTEDFSGYLAKAQADGLITRTNVNLRGTITRLQVAQLAAGAMKLDLDNLSTVKPFTDTADKHVQALNDLGIMQGFTTTTFGPNSTLTRGQVSAIVWRMQNYR